MLQNRYRRTRDREDDDVDNKRLSRSSEESEPPRRRTQAEDESRMTIAERLRRKNQELISSSDQTKSSGERFSLSRDKENVPSRGRPSLSSVSDSSNNKDIKSQLNSALKELEEYKQKYEKIKAEKEELEKQMEQYKEDIDKMQELKNDNLRLKDENGALIRVISKLSPRTPSS